MRASTQIPRIDVDTASRERLISHIDLLEYMLSSALPDLDDVEKCQRYLRLSRQQSLILGALAKGRIVTTDHLQNVAAEWNPNVSELHIRVHINSIRKCLSRYGISVKNVFGVGYEIHPENLQRLRSLLSEKEAA